MTRAVEKRKEGNDIAHEFCRALCQAAIPLHQTDGPLGDLFRRRCPAARTMPTSSQMYKKYLPDVYESDVAAIRDAIRDTPIAVTLDESPDLRGRPAVAVMVTFYNPALPGRSTRMLALKVLLQCNALTMAMLLQEVLVKFGKRLNDVSMLVTDSASYMRKLYLDLCQSDLEFAGVHVSDACHLLNNALAEGLRLEGFACVQNFVVHVTAMLKSSRELRRKFHALCKSMNMEPKFLATVCPTRWFSFYESLCDVLTYWRPILAFMKSSDAKGEKCKKLQAMIEDGGATHDLLIKMKFVRETSNSILTTLKKLESEDTLVCDVYSLLVIQLGGILQGWAKEDRGYHNDVANMLDFVDEKKRFELTETFQSYCEVVAKKWNDSVVRNVSGSMGYTAALATFWFNVRIIDPNVKSEMPPDFSMYESIFKLVSCTNAIQALQPEFREYLQYAVLENVVPVVFWRSHLSDWPILATAALRLLSLPVSSVNVERAFSKLRVINRKERARINEENLGKYMCVYYNQMK